MFDFQALIFQIVTTLVTMIVGAFITFIASKTSNAKKVIEAIKHLPNLQENINTSMESTKKHLETLVIESFNELKLNLDEVVNRFEGEMQVLKTSTESSIKLLLLLNTKTIVDIYYNSIKKGSISSSEMSSLEKLYKSHTAFEQNTLLDKYMEELYKIKEEN